MCMHNSVHNSPVHLFSNVYSCSISRPASEQFFQMLQRKLFDVIKEYQGSGVVTSHENSQLTISGPSQELIESLALKMDEFSEETLHLTPGQWNQIMSIPSKGLSKFQEMNEPFKTNPNVTVIPVGITQKDTTPVILFVGTVEAVGSAHRCFAAILNKKLALGR